MERKSDEQILLAEMQLLLSEKRTYLSISRTGLAIFAAPLTVIVFLLGTSGSHNLFGNFTVAVIVVSALIVTSLFGLMNFFSAQRKLRQLDRMIRMIESENKRIADLVI